jgi:hypothetical protein
MGNFLDASRKHVASIEAAEYCLADARQLGPFDTGALTMNAVAE